ncbi:MAG: lipoprotein [Pseudomonadota bacterium]
MRRVAIFAATAFFLTACGGTGDLYSSRASDASYSGSYGSGGDKDY